MTDYAVEGDGYFMGNAMAFADEMHDEEEVLRTELNFENDNGLLFPCDVDDDQPSERVESGIALKSLLDGGEKEELSPFFSYLYQNHLGGTPKKYK